MNSQIGRTRRQAVSIVVCLIALFTGLVNLGAQEATGTVQGSVVDSRGQAVQGASVAIASSSRVERSVVTNGGGKFAVSGLTAGTYTVETSATGFATAVRRVTVTPGATAEVSVSLVIASVAEEVTVEAEGEPSLAAQLSPVKALLDAGSARTEITSQYVSEYTSPVTDFADITQAAPGTVSWSNNGVGNGQAKIYFRGFKDDDYTMTWDGVPFNDSNDPSHHSWAYVPAPAIGYVDFDRSPGTASDIGPSNYGGSIHMFSPKLSDNMSIRASESYGSFNTNQILGEFNSGLFGGKNPKANLWFEGHHQTSDGYLTNSDQQRTAGTLKFNYKVSDKTNVTLIGTSVIVDANTPNNDATRQQIQDHGDNYLLDRNQYNPDGTLNAQWYRYYTYHVPTNFEIATLTTELSRGWKFESKAYTYSYSNHQHYQNSQDSDLLAPTPIEETVSATSGINKMNQYNRVGGISNVSAASRYGVFRAGFWYEITLTNRYQIKSNPVTWVDATGIKNIKFHEHFVTNSVQPFVEYQLVAIPRWTITAGLKDAYYNMDLKQFQDGKVVGNLCPAGVKDTTTCPAYVKHDAGYNSWLPSIEANYRITSNWSAYGQYGRGSIIPFSSVFDVTGAQVGVTPPPTIASTYQGGSVLKLNRVALDADVYHIHFVNQYSAYTPISGPDQGVDVYYATPPSNTTGVEGEANIAAGHGLSLFLNGTVGVAKYESAAAHTLTNSTTVIPATPSAWVANTPHDTETIGTTYQAHGLDLGFFNKRVGTRWDDGGGGFHQNVPYDPFWMNNLFLNYTLRKNSLFDQSKIKVSLNNLFDNHDVVSISPANTVPITGSGQIYTPDPADQLQLLPGRSVMVMFQIGFNPRER